MARRDRPAVDGAITSRFGVSREGQPLSYNRAPAPDLAPWIARMYATVIEAPGDYRIDCGMFYDVSVFRFQLSGDWIAETADGQKKLGRAALFFGPQTHRMPVSVTGGFISVGFSLRPGTGWALLGVKTEEFLDRMVTCEELGLPGEAALAKLEEQSSPEGWLRVLEGFIRQIAYARGGRPPDPVCAQFEALTLANPSVPVSELAEEVGISQRQLERIVRRDFGMSPKQVLRRARALDMAAQLRGVADEREADEQALRYYDQSHLIREFTELFDMAPSQFVSSAQPILTLALESRQARRLEALDRVAPGARRPWQ